MSRNHYRYLDKAEFSRALPKEKVRPEGTFVIIGLASGNRYYKAAKEWASWKVT